MRLMSPWRAVAILLWRSQVPLGRLAPWVLGLALGRSPRKGGDAHAE